MIYAQFNNDPSDSVLYFYLNDNENNILVLQPTGSPFSGCFENPCLTAQIELLGLRRRCIGVLASPFCAAAKDYPYSLKDHKGTPAIEIGFGDPAWIEMPANLTPSASLHDSFSGRLSEFYDNGWRPDKPVAWIEESAKLQERFSRVKEQESSDQFGCLTHLKVGQPASFLDECKIVRPEHTNSDLRGEQRIYHVEASGNGMYVGYREVFVYVDTQRQTIENVQWDDTIHQN